VSRRLVITGVAAAAIAGAVVPSFASTGTGTGTLPVTVQTDTRNGVAVGTTIFGQPGAAASVQNNGRVCAGFSYEVPQCVAIISPNSRQKLPGNPVVIQHDENGTVVGAGEVGVYISPSGRVCPLVSTQSWQCVGGDR
jgi:hypothetical protein